MNDRDTSDDWPKYVKSVKSATPDASAEGGTAVSEIVSSTPLILHPPPSFSRRSRSCPPPP